MLGMINERQQRENKQRWSDDGCLRLWAFTVQCRDLNSSKRREPLKKPKVIEALLDSEEGSLMGKQGRIYAKPLRNGAAVQSYEKPVKGVRRSTV